MYNPRSYFGIEVVDDQLFVIGGYNGPTTMLAVERYDEEAGMWYSATNIKMSRSNLSCCVLHGLYSVAESLFPRGSLTLPNVQEDPSDPEPSPHTSSIVAWWLILKIPSTRKCVFLVFKSYKMSDLDYTNLYQFKVYH